ncbi:MAG: polysaccharide deacetylase family protein [bacterium]
MSGIKENVTRVLTGLRADRCAALYYGGSGSILMFHRVVQENGSNPRLQNVSIEVSTAYLEMIVDHLKSEYDVIPLGDVPGRLRARGGRRFAVLTFDDGYLDNFTLAYPILKRQDVPFTVFVCTSFPDRNVAIWFYALEDLLLGRDSVMLTWRGAVRTWPARNLAEKREAFEALWDLIFNMAPPEWASLWPELFERHEVDLSRYAREMSMDWEQVRQLARDPLVTIGAHTVSHVPLARLNEDDMMREMAGSRQRLEDRLGIPVRHFAYPFGSSGAAGPREFAAAARAGFKTAVTTRRGNIFTSHLDHLMVLPRIDTGRTRGDLSFLRSQLGGLRALVTGQVKRVVTA